MDNKKDNNYYIKRIVTDLELIFEHTRKLTLGELEANEILVDSVMFRLIQIAENADKLTEDFKSGYATIPWRAMKGMRNRIVHEYGNVKMNVVYDTVRKDIPELLAQLKRIAE